MTKVTVKRLINSFLTALFLLISCRSGEPAQVIMDDAADFQDEKMFVVGVSWQGLTPYCLRLGKLLLELAEEADDEIRFIYMDGQNNTEKQISHVENFIAHKVDLILLNPCAFHNLASAATAANEAGIPLITIITRIEEQEICASYVGSNHKESALLQAEMVNRYLGMKGRIAILEGTIGIEAQLARAEGYKQILTQNPSLEVIASQPAFWEQDEAYVIVENWLHNGMRPDVIMSQNDSMALGALEAVTEAKLNDSIKVFGIDGDNEAVESIQEGGMEGTVFMDAFGQAKRIFECIDIIKSGNIPDKEYYVPFIVLSKDNIDDPSIRSKLRY